VTGQVLTLDDALQEHVPALLALLEALPEDSPFRHLDPPQRRQRTLEALKRVLVRESQVQPLLLVFEDLHWLDSETQALLDSLVDSLPTTHILLLVNYRPEYHHAWGSKTYYTQLRLDPLLAESADEFLQALLGDGGGAQPAAPLQALKQLLIARTAGNPFFLEESVRTLVETGVLVGERGHYRLAQDVSTLQVPATVQAVLAARIDRLPPEEKQLLQTAAVIGTDIPLLLLQAVAEQPEAALQRGLARLQAAEFLYETRLFPECAYTFKHALTHEVAYGSLLQERRRALHARIVEALERLYAERLTDHAERLAHHAFRGAMWEKALVYYRQAGARAMSHSANREATACFEQALEALQHFPESQVMMAQAIDLRFDLRNTLWPFSEHERILNHLRQAEPVAEALGDQRRLGRLAGYMSVCLRVLGDHKGSLLSAQRALAIATALGDLDQQVTANSFLGETYLWSLSDYRRAAEVCRRNVEMLHGVLLQERFGTTTVQSVSSRALLAVCLAELGVFPEGRVHGEEALRSAEMVDHSYSLAWACVGLGHLALRQGTLPQAIRVLEQGLTLSEAVNLPLSLNMCKVRLGAAYALAGRVPAALRLLEQALAQARARRYQSYPSFAVWLGEGYMLAGRMAEAVSLGQWVLEAARAEKQQGYQAYALHLLGDIAAHREPPEIDQADTHYQQALVLADTLGMRPLQAHCYLGRGTLYSKLGCAEQARMALSTAIDLYRAMDMTFWLPQAEAALARVE
jgi:tetratricopeptide (TPR) repeat protein